VTSVEERRRSYWLRLRHRTGWQWSKNVAPQLARIGVEYRWRVTARQRPHLLPRKLIVSLTSHPPRFGTLALTIRSLLRQTVKADHTILWIAHDDMRFIPKDVRDLQNVGLEIRGTQDLKSYLKIIPTLDNFPEAFICTADDDLYYWSTWLEELVEGLELNNRIVTCHRAHEMTLDPAGDLRPYQDWQLDIPFRGTSPRLFPTGAMGALYPPGILAHTVEDRFVALELCPKADDVWLYWIGSRNGAQYKTVGRHRLHVMWPSARQVTLWAYNSGGGNDLQIRNLAKKYGYPPMLAKMGRELANSNEA
jgi:hypothetical protein